MKAINSKIALFGLASMTILMASCSDSNTDNGSIINANIVGSAVKSTTDAQELATRVYNYKGIYTNAATASAKTRAAVATRAEEIKQPEIPADAKKLSSVDQIWNAHPGNYVVEDGETVKGDGMNIQGMTIYIKKGGKFIYGGAYNQNDTKENTINVLAGGTLVARNSNEIFGTTKVMNYGTIEFPSDQNEYIVKNTFYDYSGDLNIKGKTLNLQGDINSLLYVQKDLIAKEVKISGSAQLYVNHDANVEGQFYLTNQSQAWVNNVLSCDNVKMDSNVVLHSGCAIKATNDVYITNGANLYIQYLKAANFYQDSNGVLHLSNQTMVDVADVYRNLNNGMGKADLPDKDGVAVIKCKRMVYNAPGKQGDWSEGGAKTIDCSILSTSGDNANIVVEAEGVYEQNGTTKVTDQNTTIVWNNNANIHWYTDADAKNYVVKKTECNPEGYNDNSGNSGDSGNTGGNTGGDSGNTDPDPVPTPTPDPDAPETNNKPSLDLITSIDYDHDHDISATCIQPLNGHLYMSYHTRGDQSETNATGHGGCVEVFTPVTNDKVTLEQYLYDNERDLDFNHLLATQLNSGDKKIYLPGTSFKKGAMLGYMTINNNGLLADQSKAITSAENGTLTYEQPLNFVQLGKAIAANKGTDENCVVYNNQTNHLIVMTTKGYTIYDATSLETVGSYDKLGKAKHVAIGNDKIVTLHLDRQATSQSEAIPATIEVFDQKSENFDSPTASFSVSTIEPNNGKNVIQVKDNKIYVCRGAAGLYCYDMSGKEEWHYQMPKPINAQGNYKAYANGCYVGDKYIYVAYGSFGLMVLDKNTHEPVAHRATPKSANYVVEHDGYIYVAYGQSRLQVFKLCNVQ